TVTAVASRALLIHGLPVIEVNDPARPVGTAGGSSNSTSWLGAVTYVKLSALPRSGSGISERAGHARALTLVMRLMGCLLVALVTVRFGIQIGVIVTLLAVWLLPTLVTRHSQNRRASVI